MVIYMQETILYPTTFTHKGGKYMQSMLYPKTSRTRRIVDMNGLWKFCFDPQSEGLKHNWQNGLDPRRTIEMPVPASFNDFFTYKESREYT